MVGPKSEGAPARASSSLFCSIPNRRAQNLFYFWLNLADHQLHRPHCRLVLGVAHLERETNVDWMGCTDFANQLFGHGLDIADQQVVADWFKWRLVGERLVDQQCTLHDLLPPPQAGGQAGLVARIFGKAQPLFLAVRDVAKRLTVI